MGVTINRAFFPKIPFVAEISDVVSMDPYSIITDTVYTMVRKGFKRNAQVIKSLSIGEKKKITVGTIIHPAYALPKSMDNKGAIIRLIKIKKANIAVNGRL